MIQHCPWYLPKGVENVGPIKTCTWGDPWVAQQFEACLRLAQGVILESWDQVAFSSAKNCYSLLLILILQHLNLPIIPKRPSLLHK